MHFNQLFEAVAGLILVCSLAGASFCLHRAIGVRFVEARSTESLPKDVTTESLPGQCACSNRPFSVGCTASHAPILMIAGLVPLDFYLNLCDQPPLVIHHTTMACGAVCLGVGISHNVAGSENLCFGGCICFLICFSLPFPFLCASFGSAHARVAPLGSVLCAAAGFDVKAMLSFFAFASL